MNSQKHWIQNEDGVAAVEFTLVFPLMFLMMLAIWDLGYAIVSAQKAIGASQMVADLVAREIVVSDAELQEAFTAGELVMQPMPVAQNMTIEVLSVAYHETTGATETVFHDTSNGSAPDGTLVNFLGALSVPNEGAVAVQVTYTYEPFFGDMVLGDIVIKERAFARGRKTAVVCDENSSSTRCSSS